MTTRLTRTTDDEAGTARLGAAVARALRAGDIIALHGPLGAGKTTLVRAIAAGVGIDAALVSSPTFVVVNEYPAPNETTPDLVHIDAYRLSGADDLDALGWDRLVPADPIAPPAGAAPHPTAHAPILLIEWAERIAAALPPPDRLARITIEPTDERARRFVFDLPDGWAERPGVDALRAFGSTRCRITGKPVPQDSPTYPFFDEKARLADLYRWMAGGYSIEREIKDADLEGPA